MKTAEHIIETVDKLVRKYHTRDPYELCQLLGIKIHYYDLQKKLKGFFYYQLKPGISSNTSPDKRIS